ncbi:MAG: hypothetical protein E7Z87_07310 [Cyanobacteria bacterium SIG26]|nr:hypothetical protein [Cyanobacteria bacterium SIG26]
MTHQRPIDAINRTATSSGQGYVNTDLNINKTNPETRSIIRDTLAFLKLRPQDYSSFRPMWEALGFCDNVNLALQDAVTDPNKSFTDQKGITYSQIPAVGRMVAYDLDGNQTGGCCTTILVG